MYVSFDNDAFEHQYRFLSGDYFVSKIVTTAVGSLYCIDKMNYLTGVCKKRFDRNIDYTKKLFIFINKKEESF